MDVISELGLTSIARLLGCKPQSVIEWRRRGIPLDRCAALESGTAGKYVCEQMRPDVRWIRIPDADWPWHPEGRPCIDVTRPSAAGPAEQPAESEA